jgi:hypothetical protein
VVIADCQLPIANCRLPIADFEELRRLAGFQIGNRQSAIGN